MDEIWGGFGENLFRAIGIWGTPESDFNTLSQLNADISPHFVTRTPRLIGLAVLGHLTIRPGKN
ncbi:hypothetical protein PHISCL_10629 [Aspergillus sclerotialis]|uniref:Uncharacterized protein n=1 Tax=Aspergillus sclerotialis TaxID=2070753 RepID=A0A3A2ZCD5_9EURO|nr:hypothetical protein PHISCL_10629 [Aspergillus sclerotialis]